MPVKPVILIVKPSNPETSALLVALLGKFGVLTTNTEFTERPA